MVRSGCDGKAHSASFRFFCCVFAIHSRRKARGARIARALGEIPRGRRRANRRRPRVLGSGTTDLQGYCRKTRDGLPVDTGVEGAAAGRPADHSLRFLSGEEGPTPPGGRTPGPVPVYAVGPGPARCAKAGTADASAAIIAAVLSSFFISLVLCCSSRMVRAAEKAKRIRPHFDLLCVLRYTPRSIRNGARSVALPRIRPVRLAVYSPSALASHRAASGVRGQSSLRRFRAQAVGNQ